MKKVAVINRTNLKNFGSVLQCFALCEAVKSLGYESEIVWERGNLSKNFDFRPMKIISSLLKLVFHPSLWSSTMVNVNDMNSRKITEETIKKFNEFVSEEITQKTSSHYGLKKIAKSDEYYKFICGSDQIWCSTTLYVDPLMYLRFAPKGKRIAYAPSIGRDFIPNYNRRKMKKFISQIPYLSVRENEGQRLIKELTGRDALVVLDPVLLREKSAWDNVKRECSEQDKYLLCYFLDAPSTDTQEKISSYAKLRGLNIVALGATLSKCEEEGVKVTYPEIGPREFIGYIESAEETITDSYHGMLFSIIYGKQFWSIEREYQQYDQSSRQKTVLDLLKLNVRYLSKGQDIPHEDSDIDYISVNTIIEEEREKSLNFLKESIESSL